MVVIRGESFQSTTSLFGSGYCTILIDTNCCHSPFIYRVGLVSASFFNFTCRRNSQYSKTSRLQTSCSNVTTTVSVYETESAVRTLEDNTSLPEEKKETLFIALTFTTIIALIVVGFISKYLYNIKKNNRTTNNCNIPRREAEIELLMLDI